MTCFGSKIDIDESNGGEINLSHQNGPALIPFDPNDPRAVRQITTSFSDTKNPEHSFQSFMYQETNLLGEKSKKMVSIFFRPQQDVIDTLLYSKNESGEYTFYLLEKLRPVLALREKLNLAPLNDSGRQINLPGFYFKEDGSASGIQGAVDSYINTFGLKLNGNIRTLGPAYFVGSFSTELAFPKIVEVSDSNPKQKVEVKYGNAFEGHVALHKKSPLEFYNDIQSGTINDLRAIQAFYRFCELEGINLPNANINLSENISINDVAIPILDKSQIRQRIKDTQITINSITPKGVTLTSPDLIALTSVAQNIRNGDEIDNSDQYTFDVCMYRLPDSVHPIPHFLADKSVYMVVNIRQAVVPILRNQVAHQIYTNDTSHRLEGIFEREPIGLSESDRRAFIEDTLLSRWGLSVTSDPEYLGQGTFSPGFDPEVGRFYATMIDPTQPLEGEYADLTCAVRLEDVAGLIETGEIRSLETIVAYEYLKKHYGFVDQKIQLDAESEQLKNELTEILNQSSTTRKTLASQHPTVYAQMMSTHSGQNVIAYILNEGPGITYAHSSASIEAGLFDGTSGISPLDSKENQHEAGLLSFHDMMHAIRRDPPVIGLSLAEYTQALLERECDALWFSEVHIPSIYGFDNFRNYCNKTSLGEVFMACGLTTIRQQRDAIESMVINGVIPAELINHPRYTEIQWCIHEKLIGYYVRDKLENCELLYDAKMQTPYASEVLAKFYPENPVLLEDVLEYSHAVNNLKEYTVTLRSEKSSRSISKLAWLIEDTARSRDESEQVLLYEARKVVDKLAQAHKTLSELSQRIHSSEVNPENIEIYRQIKAIEEGPIFEAEEFCRRHWHQDREFPAATIHPFFTTDEQIKQIHAIEREQLLVSNNKHLCV